MPSVVHLVTTGNLAGVERYVCTTADETATRGWQVTVVGGSPERMRWALHPDVRWFPGATPAESLRSLARIGRQDICHAHMTVAEAIAVSTRPLHRAPIVSTRHFAAPRGSSRSGRFAAPWISMRLTRQIAISEYVARQLERPPDAVIRNGVPPSPCLWRPASRVVLVLQRLEAEKDTLTALRAWKASRLADEGWSMRVVGGGSERAALEAWTASARASEIVFSGWTSRVSEELSAAGIFLAPAPGEPFGLGVVEAMAAGVPVVACGAGGHLETACRLPNAPVFPPHDTFAAAGALRSLLTEKSRAALSDAGRRLAEDEFTIARHVDQLLVEYQTSLGRAGQAPSGDPGVPGDPGAEGRSGRGQRRNHRKKGMRDTPPNDALRQLVVCSLEPWDEVWRRNQFFTDILMRRNPALRVLFIEPPSDPLFDLSRRRVPTLPRVRSISADDRLCAFRPLKLLPRKVGPLADALLRAQVLLATRLLGYTRPHLWVNDVTYAPLLASTGWPSVYDVTDDWLLAPFTPRELERLRRLDAVALDNADETVVCSPALAVSRGARRPVTLIPNGVDLEHFRRPRPRPYDLPGPPLAVYVGSLHDARIDVELVGELARALPQLNIALVGPNSLTFASQNLLGRLPNVLMLGRRPYSEVPAYLQHADVVVVPHRVSPFTESLDPIKVYECLTLRTPTVATAVAGFRDYATELNVVERDAFVARVAEVILADPRPRGRDVEPATWQERAVAFERVLVQAAARRRSPPRTAGPVDVDPL